MPSGVVHAGLVKYECLGVFCFNFGFLGHRFQQCSLPLLDKDDPKKLPYGPWMSGVDGLRSIQLVSISVVD